MAASSEDEHEHDDGSYRTASSFPSPLPTAANTQKLRRVSERSDHSDRTVRNVRSRSSDSTPSRRTGRSEVTTGPAASRQQPSLAPRPPPMSRKSTSRLGKALHPHRIFSTDDSEREIQADADAILSRADSRTQALSGERRLAPFMVRPISSGLDLEETSDEQELGSDGEALDNEGEVNPEDDIDGASLHTSASDESFTLKARQEAINKSHPFGIRIWKPALYKKKRSVQKAAEGEIHSTPGRRNLERFSLGNVLWTLLFGWWISLVVLVVAVVCFMLVWTHSGRSYGRLCVGLAVYMFYPFGQYVELKTDEQYAEEDEGLGRTFADLADIEHFATSNPSVSAPADASWNDEHQPLLTGIVGGRTNTQAINPKRRAFGRGQWSLGRIVFFLLYYLLVVPVLSLVAIICWLAVFPLPMAKLCFLLIHHLRSHPLALSFHWSIKSSFQSGSPDRTVILCTYRAMGLRYYKYTVDGTNIFFINLLFVVLFTILDNYVLVPIFGSGLWFTSRAFIFAMSLLSIIPLAYFVGQAVASISAQSSIGMGAAINAFFGSVIEIFLYCVALSQGKGLLVEGSIVGSILAGILLMPGLSMCSGAVIRKTLRFNAKAAGITSTMMLFAVIGAFGPTLFYQIYGSYELKCTGCRRGDDCKRCYFDQNTAISDPFYQESVKPFTYLCAVLLILSYLIGLWFTLRTHAALIWQTTPVHEVKHSIATEGHGMRESCLDSPRLASRPGSVRRYPQPPSVHAETRDVGTSRVSAKDVLRQLKERRGQSLADLITKDPMAFYERVAEIASHATASALERDRVVAKQKRMSTRTEAERVEPSTAAVEEEALPHSGHDAPNWSRLKSVAVLLVATLFYAIIAEILVDTVDVVLENIQIEEKFLGFTLFALVPNTTEFMNAISFAMSGNIELSMEIGSAYALQVLLLQIPALVAFSAYKNWDRVDIPAYTFSLIFPRMFHSCFLALADRLGWDLVMVILCVFLLAHVYAEGKSNYFKGSILIMSYIVVGTGFYNIPVKEEGNI
ncbi:hypothetical protein BCR37DRAFT_384575 [Protomyces lactucae-debilis]|uniref:Sodium/calcium exchanger protein-domain-containing protein n=1 Tax=Protomyces lactucae-debilis TaxID=2754530 RepID=A0A1Y2ESL3_PROLT|nr:uncharacterized protein BCR37DRAFT_384575 [Protomyces lactucae-debilis]ORY74146.1 hypothetical protein BCR37DRAFT_384575 [Protomyces lactucae-debilis]